MIHIRRAIAGWFLLLMAAIANGTVRQALLEPAMGEAKAHVLSSVLLSFVIFGLGWLLSGWLKLGSARAAWLVGGWWLGLTIGFEFLGGHFLFGAPWSKLLSNYDVSRGRIWVLVLLATALTPPLVHRMRR